MTKNNRGLIITLIILLCIAVLMLGGIMTFLILSNNGRNYIDMDFENHNKIIYDESFDSSNIKKLTIRSDSGDIDIKHSTGNEIRVVARGGKAENFILENNNNTITIDNKSQKRINKNPFSNALSIYSDVDIYLPDDCLEKLEISSDYGDVDIENSVNSNLIIECEYGDISASGLFGTFDIHTDCGDIELNEINLTSNSSITTNLGDIEIKRTNDIRIDYDTSLGECEVKNNNSKSDIVLTAKTDLGDIEINS